MTVEIIVLHKLGTEKPSSSPKVLVSSFKPIRFPLSTFLTRFHHFHDLILLPLENLFGFKLLKNVSKPT